MSRTAPPTVMMRCESKHGSSCLCHLWQGGHASFFRVTCPTPPAVHFLDCWSSRSIKLITTSGPLVCTPRRTQITGVTYESNKHADTLDRLLGSLKVACQASALGMEAYETSRRNRNLLAASHVRALTLCTPDTRDHCQIPLSSHASSRLHELQPAGLG